MGEDGLKEELEVVLGGKGGGFRSISDDEIFFNCPWFPTDSCPLEDEICSDRPCRMMRLVKR